MTQEIEMLGSVLFLSKLPRDFDDRAACEFFKQFDEIEGVIYPRNKKTG